jgi:hypothetical protein
MDAIREHLIYKNTPLTICFAKLTPQEHYECIRVFLESKTEHVKFCTHDATNPYIDHLLKELNVSFTQCWKEDELLLRFDPHMERTPSR